MKIGIDLDGVVFDSEKDFRIYSELYDMIDLKQNSKVDNGNIRFQDRFNWTEEECENFLKKYHKQIIREANYMPGAIKILKMLKEEGNSLIIITARGEMNEEIITLTNERLKKDKMDIFDKYYWKTENKDEICVKENIDIMIDDSYEKCRKISNAKINTIYFKDAPSYDLTENQYLKVLYNWGEIYRYIKEMETK